MSNLFDLGEGMSQLQLMISDEEITFEDVKDTLESLDMAFEEKANGIKYLELQLDGEVETLEKRKKQIDERIKAKKERKANLKNYLMEAMLYANKTKFKTAEFTFDIKNNATQSDEEKLDITKVPREYFIDQEQKLDSKKLLNDIKAGKEIETAELKTTESVVIR